MKKMAETLLQSKTEKKVEPVNLSVDKTRTYLYEKNTRQLAEDILADGYVSPDEEVKIEANHEEIIRDFLVSVDLLEKMEKNPNAYSSEALQSIRFVVNRLHRAREVSLAKIQQISYSNFIPPHEKQIRQERRKNKEYLDINFNLYQIFSLEGNAHEVIRYARKQEKDRQMTPEQARQTEKRIMELVNLIIEKGHKERYIQQFLEQNNTRMS